MRSVEDAANSKTSPRTSCSVTDRTSPPNQQLRAPVTCSAGTTSRTMADVKDISWALNLKYPWDRCRMRAVVDYTFPTHRAQKKNGSLMDLSAASPGSEQDRQLPYVGATQQMH